MSRKTRVLPVMRASSSLGSDFLMMVAPMFSVVVVGVQMTIFLETLRSKMSSWTTRAACCATPCCAPVVDTLMMSVVVVLLSC